MFCLIIFSNLIKIYILIYQQWNVSILTSSNDHLSRCRPREYKLQIEGSRSLNSSRFIHSKVRDDSSLLSGDSRYTDYNKVLFHYITRYLSRFVSAQIRIIGYFHFGWRNQDRAACAYTWARTPIVESGFFCLIALLKPTLRVWYD